MKVGKIAKIGILSGLVSLCSCSKQQKVFYPAQNVPQRVINKINSLNLQTNIIKRDSRYKFFGKDTLEITEDVFDGTRVYLNKLNKEAQKNTPKVKTGMHLENHIVPKTGEGTDIIPVMKPTYEPVYVNQKTVISSSDVFTRSGDDYYVPVEYYGMPNPKIKGQ